MTNSAPNCRSASLQRDLGTGAELAGVNTEGYEFMRCGY
jgi:hypothetical protein